MMREGIPKGRASMSKTTRGKSNVDTRLEEEIEGCSAKLTRWRIYGCSIKRTNIEGQCCGVNDGQK